VLLSPSSEGGARIATQAENGQAPVASGSPAAKAGLKAGDLITAVNGTKVTSTDGFIAAVFGDDPGQTVTLTVQRNGQTNQVKVTLGNRPASPANAG
jgi:putative serine protease PepD